MSDLPLWRRVSAVVGAIVLLAILGLSLMPTGQIAVLPSAPVQLDGRVDIGDGPPSKLQGRVAFVGVDDEPVRLLHKWWIQLRDDDVTFAPDPAKERSDRSGDVPTDDPSEARALTLAKRVASGIAFDLAEQPADWQGTNVTVTSVAPGSPAATAGMQGGDSVISVDGREVDNAVDAGKILYAHEPGTVAQLVVRRDGRDSQYSVTTMQPPAGDTVHRSVIGAELDTIGLQVDLPKSVSINSGGAVGTSGGLAFALYVYDAVSDADLAKGRSIVATGALTPDGLVLPVQRLRQKAIATQRAGADLLLVPADNVDEAVAGVDEACDSDVRCVRVVPVSSVANAIALLGDRDALRRVARRVENG